MCTLTPARYVPRLLVVNGAPPLRGRGSDRGAHPPLADHVGPVVQLVDDTGIVVLARTPDLEVLKPMDVSVTVILWGHFARYWARSTADLRLALCLYPLLLLSGPCNDQSFLALSLPAHLPHR